MNIDTWSNDMILDAINVNYSESKQKSIHQFSGATLVDYDTPKPTDVMHDAEYINRGILNEDNTDQDYIESIKPLKLDKKFSDWIEMNQQRKSKITEYLEKVTELNPRILPLPKIVKQKNPFHSKTIMCKEHNRPATKACMLLHYGQYFCNSWNHECGEVEDLEQSSKIRVLAMQDAVKVHKELINKAESLIYTIQVSPCNQWESNWNEDELWSKCQLAQSSANSWNNPSDIDLIFHWLFDSIKWLHQELKSKNIHSIDDKELINNFMQKVYRAWDELKWIRSQVEEMYNKKDYYGIYKWKREYQLKLVEISETKEDFKHYIKLINSERQAITGGEKDVVTGALSLIRDYFHQRNKIV